MKKYLSLFRIHFTGGLQYRIAALAGISTQFAWGFMSILLYRAFYRASPDAFPMSFSQLSTYIWLQQAFLSMFSGWALDNDIAAKITEGSIAYDMARPVSLYPMWFTQSFATRCCKALLRCFPVLIVASFLPHPYGLSLPHSGVALLVFVMSLLLGCCIQVSFLMLIYISTFYTLSPRGSMMILLFITDFLGGQMIPLPFFPDAIRRIAELLPFAYIQDFPLRVYNGAIVGMEIVTKLVLQLIWLTALVVFGNLWMRLTAKHVVVQGG